MKDKQQIILIHGGTTFDTYEEYIEYLKSCTLSLDKIDFKDWKDNLQLELPEYEVIYPKMPNAKNARYKEWKIWFEKLIPLIDENIILVGHSLGGIFLAKYLSENTFPKTIKQLHLVAPPYDTEACKDSLVDFALNNTVEDLTSIAERLFLYHSTDDTAVPFADAEKYVRDLPLATFTVFENRGHFTQEVFPELIQNIQSI